MNPVPIELVQAAADALLRFHNLPDDVHKQFVGYIEGRFVVGIDIVGTRYNYLNLDLNPWLLITDKRAENESLFYWVKRYHYHVKKIDAYSCAH